MPIDALASIILLTALFIVVYGPWQTYCTDAGRQTLFEIRDELFDMACEGKLSFDSKQYRTIRVSIEQSIRYAHTLTIWRFFVIYAHTLRIKGTDNKSELTSAVESIADPEVREKAQQLSIRATIACIQMMVAKAPLFIVVLLVFKLTSRTSKLFDGAKGYFSSFSNTVRTRVGEAIQIEAENVCAQ